MSHRIELIAAVLSTVLGLIWLVYQASLLQTLWVSGVLTGAFGRSVSQPIGFNGTGIFFLGSALILIGVTVGAYLHVIQRSSYGLPLLCTAAALLTFTMAAYIVAPWQFVPVQFAYVLQELGYAWLLPAGVLSVICVWVAALASLPVPVADERVRPSGSSEPFGAV